MSVRRFFLKKILSIMVARRQCPYRRAGMLTTMVRARKVMSAACVSTRGSELCFVHCFTRFMGGNGGKVGECTHRPKLVQCSRLVGTVKYGYYACQASKEESYGPNNGFNTSR